MAREMSASGLRETAMPHPLVPLGRDGSRDAEKPLPDLLAGGRAIRNDDACSRAKHGDTIGFMRR
jgi:hypothetical protein